MIPTMLSALDNCLQYGPSVESELTLGGRQKDLEMIRERIRTRGYTNTDFTNEEANLLIYCLLDAAYYYEVKEEVLKIFDEICPQAAATIRSDTYINKYRRVSDEELTAWYKERCRGCENYLDNTNEGWCYMFDEFVENCSQYTEVK
jgi:hypothetical protein